MTGPHVEVNQYGHATGAVFVRCEGYGREVLGGDPEAVPHADACPLASAEEKGL